MPLLLKFPQGEAVINIYFPSIQDQTGWKRTNPLHLLTDYDTLIKVSSLNYDLLNKDFVNYAKSRGCMNGAGSPSPVDPDYTEESFDLTYSIPSKSNIDPYVIRRYVRCHWLTKENFMSSEEKIYTVSSDSKKPKAITGKAKESIWDCIIPARAHLQDCWEVWLINYCNFVVTGFSCDPRSLLMESRNHIKNRLEIDSF